MKTAYGASRAMMGLTVMCSLLLACGDGAPASGADTGRPDVATDAVVADTTGGGDTGAMDATDVVTQDAGDVAVVDVVAPDAPSLDAGDGSVGDGGDGGAGLRAHRGTALVGAGGVMTSTGFRMVSTLGQSTVHQGVMRSAGFRLQGGLAGATGGRSR